MTNASKTTFEVIQEIWKGFAKPFTSLLVFAIFLMVIVAVSGAVYPAIIQQVFNHLSGEETILKYNFLTIVDLIESLDSASIVLQDDQHYMDLPGRLLLYIFFHLILVIVSYPMDFLEYTL